MQRIYDSQLIMDLPSGDVEVAHFLLVVNAASKKFESVQKREVLIPTQYERIEKVFKTVNQWLKSMAATCVHIKNDWRKRIPGKNLPRTVP